MPLIHIIAPLECGGGRSPRIVEQVMTYVVALFVGGCSQHTPGPMLGQNSEPGAIHKVGPVDGLDIFVWRMPDLSRTVTVRPDGRISMPLIDDLVATGKTPTELAPDIEHVLVKYVEDPTVTVIVGANMNIEPGDVLVIPQAWF